MPSALCPLPNLARLLLYMPLAMEGKNKQFEKEGREKAQYISFYNSLLATADVSGVFEMTLTDRIACEMALYIDELERRGTLDRIISSVQKLADRSGK